MRPGRPKRTNLPRVLPAAVFAVAALLTAGVLAVPGCAEKDAPKPVRVSSAWPRADAERVVPEPVRPPVWPLTGLDAPTQSAIQARVVAVKVENSAEARPQSGLNDADVVYESLAEGGVTRFNALFHSKLPEVIGPVRSARMSDITIVPQYGALFFFSGASRFVNGALENAGLPLLSEDAGVSRPYYRSSLRRSPHNLYLKGELAREEGRLRGFPPTQSLLPLAFDPRSSAQTTTVTSIGIPFSTLTPVTWTYDPAAEVYLRDIKGVPQTDAATDEQIRAKNVVVLWAVMRSTGHGDVNRNPTYDIVLTGTNRASVFRSGQRFDGMWSATAADPPVFKDAKGNAIELAPGNSWFEVIPANANISLK